MWNWLYTFNHDWAIIYLHPTSAVTLTGVGIVVRGSGAEHVTSQARISFLAVSIGQPDDSRNFQVRRLIPFWRDGPPTTDDEATSGEGLANIRRQASDPDGARDWGRRRESQERKVEVLSVRVVARVLGGGLHVDVDLSVAFGLFNSAFEEKLKHSFSFRSFYVVLNRCNFNLCKFVFIIYLVILVLDTLKILLVT